MRKGLSIAALVVVTICLAWASLMVLSTLQIQRMVAADPSSRNFGRRETENESARALHQIAFPVDVASREKGLKPGTPAVRGRLGDIGTILNQANSEIPLPADVEAFLQQQRPGLDRFRELLRKGPSPRWTRDDSLLEKAPCPNLVELMFMQKVLAADALSAEKRGDHDKAWQTLEAQWVLAGALWSRPELISNLIALASTRMINAAARKLPAPAPVWWREVEAFDVDRHLQQTMEYEKWLMTQRVLAEGHGERPPQRLMAFLVAPIERYQASQIIDYYDDLGKTPLDCREFKPGPDAGDHFLSWFGAGIWTSSLDGVRIRLARFTLERELSSKVLGLKEARRTGRLLPDVSPSRCGTWKAASVDGQITLRYSGVVPHTDSPIVPMPLELTF